MHVYTSITPFARRQAKQQATAKLQGHEEEEKRVSSKVQTQLFFLFLTQHSYTRTHEHDIVFRDTRDAQHKHSLDMSCTREMMAIMMMMTAARTGGVGEGI